MVSTRSRVRLTTRFTGPSDVLLLGYSLMGPEDQEVLPEDRLSLSYHVVCQRQAGFNERGGLELSSQWIPGYPRSGRDFSVGAGPVADVIGPIYFEKGPAGIYQLVPDARQTL